jgi:hypothetical protein
MNSQRPGQKFTVVVRLILGSGTSLGGCGTGGRRVSTGPVRDPPSLVFKTSPREGSGVTGR